MIKKITEKFNPLMFLGSLGAGGLAVAVFAALNYTLPHGKGLIHIGQTHAMKLSGAMSATVFSLEALMALLILVHLVLSAVLFVAYKKWRKTDVAQGILCNPLANGGLMAPYVSAAMTLNVLLSSVRYFIPQVAENLQAFVLPGFIVWAILWVLVLLKETEMLKISFTQEFDVSKLHFGWLLHPFALVMISVTGAGIAALAHNESIAGAAAFMTLITGTMGGFLLMVKLNAIFKQHFTQSGMPEEQFLPSILIIIPNITLLAITAFRLLHYTSHTYHIDLHVASIAAMVGAFAFEIWYLLFGLAMLKDYRKTYLKTHFHVSQWGLVCPFVAFAVLGSFVYKLALPSLPMFLVILATIILTTLLYFYLLSRQYKCIFKENINGFTCDK